MKLPCVQTWWCGQPVELAYVLEHLHELVIKSAYPTVGEDPVFGSNLAGIHGAGAAYWGRACN